MRLRLLFFETGKPALMLARSAFMCQGFLPRLLELCCSYDELVEYSD